MTTKLKVDNSHAENYMGVLDVWSGRGHPVIAIRQLDNRRLENDMKEKKSKK